MDVIDFANGQPSSNELPDDLILQATAHALGAAPGGRDCAEGREASSKPLEYGDFTIRFRAELSKFLGRCDPSRGGVEPDPARLLPTGGVSQALDMLCTVCASPRARDVVLVETPTYFLASAIFRDHELEVRGVETDAEGIVPAALRASLEGLRAEGRKCAFLYVIPVHHNPTGRTMTDARRREVVDLAGAHGALVVADEVYTLLTYGSAATPPSLSTLGDGVLSLGSFAKVLAPGLRVGWVEGSRTLMDKLWAWSVTISGGYVSHFASCIVASALEQRLADQHLSRLRELYERRLAAMLAALHTHLPEACEQLCPPSGGFRVAPPTAWRFCGGACESCSVAEFALQRRRCVLTRRWECFFRSFRTALLCEAERRGDPRGNEAFGGSFAGCVRRHAHWRRAPEVRGGPHARAQPNLHQDRWRALGLLMSIAASHHGSGVRGEGVLFLSGPDR